MVVHTRTSADLQKYVFYLYMCTSVCVVCVRACVHACVCLFTNIQASFGVPQIIVINTIFINEPSYVLHALSFMIITFMLLY